MGAALHTIFALASATGKAGVAVIRLSGPQSWWAVERLAGKVPEPRRLSLRTVRGQSGVIDHALVVVFSGPGSFTGEDAAELHLHGSRAVVAAVLQELAAFEGLRPAEPGEFTRRALENGVLDLAQVEGLSDLIDAETEAQRRQAMRVMSGAIGERVGVWRQSLVRAAALIEATIDFADEDVPVDVRPEVSALVSAVVAALEDELSAAMAARQIRDGFEVAILGPPNAGKSTLLNALAGREAAITSAIAGTTRDVIEVRMEIAGQAVTLLDTAGLRDTSDEVEVIGVARARQRGAQADLRIVLEDGTPLPGLDLRDGDIRLRAKCDDPADAAGGQGISGLTGAGLDWLVSEIGERLSRRVANAGVMVRARHEDAVRRGLAALRMARDGLGGGVEPELIAEELRSAIRALDFLVGRVDVEDLLGEIFARFCIGK
jgi:tRNA modification GTPase